jgi:hypothetical protein
VCALVLPSGTLASAAGRADLAAAQPTEETRPTGETRPAEEMSARDHRAV